MSLLTRHGAQAELPAIRDILNHYILKTAVTFEMEEGFMTSGRLSSAKERGPCNLRMALRS